MKKFFIEQFCDHLYERPKVSYKIREYIEDLVLKEILEPHKIIINTKWHHAIYVSLEKEPFRSAITMLPPNTHKDVLCKTYSTFVVFTSIPEDANPNLKFAKLLYDIIQHFFVHHYKKVSKEYLEKIENKIDWDYLSNIDYPASFDDQKYAMDHREHVRQIYIEKFGY